MAAVASTGVLLASVLAVTGCGGAVVGSSATTAAVLTADASSTSAPQPLAGVVIGIDPGHNGKNYTRPDIINRQIFNGREMESCNTTGTATNGGYSEALFNWKVATFLAKRLRQAGATVVMTRKSNNGVGPCVDKRARIINNAKAQVAIDIHGDGGPASGRGFALLLPVKDGINNKVVAPSVRYAKLLRTEMRKTGMPTSTYDGRDGLTYRSDLAGLNLTKVPQVLMEVGNMRNATDTRLMTSATFQKKVAAAIARAMRRFIATAQR